MNNRLATLALAVATALGTTAANASLVYLGPADFSGSGLGSVNTVLTLQATGSGTTESGAVAWNGASDVITGDAKTGASQTQTRSLSELGVTSASTLWVVLNANEISNDSIQLDSLVLNIYSPGGSLLFTSGPTFQFFPETLTGTGNSGFVFGLDAQQAASAQAAAFAGAFGANRVGLSASLSLVSNGPETFYVTQAPVAPIPEPGNLALLASGLLALGGIARKKKQ